jgi:ParB family chromosome partitioning protein
MIKENQSKLINTDGVEENIISPETNAMANIENERIINLPPAKLAVFDNHPFKVTQDEDFGKLLDSIRENGILTPLIARPKGDKFELVSGHRRKLAAAIAGLDTVPVVVRNLTDEQAIISMVDSNVQRENVLPSEKAYAYKMKLEALNRQLGRPSEKEGQIVPQYSGKRSTEILGESSGESYKQVQRFIRLTELIPPLLKMVDDKRIAFNPAVELSFLPKEQQASLLSVMEAEQASPSLAQAQKLKSLSGNGALSEDKITDIMREQKANQVEQIKIPYDKVIEIIKRDIPLKELGDFILKAVTEYDKRLRQREQSRSAR